MKKSEFFNLKFWIFFSDEHFQFFSRTETFHNSSACNITFLASNFRCLLAVKMKKTGRQFLSQFFPNVIYQMYSGFPLVTWDAVLLVPEVFWG